MDWAIVQKLEDAQGDGVGANLYLPHSEVFLSVCVCAGDYLKGNMLCEQHRDHNKNGL